MTQQPGYWIVPQGQTITPGQTVDISVGMTSPIENGAYKSYWGLKKENGQFLPIQGGVNGNSFYVKIKVDDGSNDAPGKITAASIDIELEQGSGTVCTANSTYFVQAYITADGPTTATYEIESIAGQIPAGNFTDGYLTPVYPVEYGTVIFDRAGTKTISYRFVGPYPYPNDITILLRVNSGEWHNTKLLCQ
jgi:Ig-like domain from next to BRCA1 gene